MDYKEPKRRVTKNDKKNQKRVYSQKHVRNILKQKEQSIDKNRDGTLQSTKLPLFANGRIRV